MAQSSSLRELKKFLQQGKAEEVLYLASQLLGTLSPRQRRQIGHLRTQAEEVIVLESQKLDYADDHWGKKLGRFLWWLAQSILPVAAFSILLADYFVTGNGVSHLRQGYYYFAILGFLLLYFLGLFVHTLTLRSSVQKYINLFWWLIFSLGIGFIWYRDWFLNDRLMLFNNWVGLIGLISLFLILFSWIHAYYTEFNFFHRWSIRPLYFWQFLAVPATVAIGYLLFGVLGWVWATGPAYFLNFSLNWATYWLIASLSILYLLNFSERQFVRAHPWQIGGYFLVSLLVVSVLANPLVSIFKTFILTCQIPILQDLVFISLGCLFFSFFLLPIAVQLVYKIWYEQIEGWVWTVVKIMILLLMMMAPLGAIAYLHAEVEHRGGLQYTGNLFTYSAPADWWDRKEAVYRQDSPKTNPPLEKKKPAARPLPPAKSSQ